MKFTYLYILLCILDLLAFHFLQMGRLLTFASITAALLFFYISSLPKQHSFILLGLSLGMVANIVSVFPTYEFFSLSKGLSAAMFLCYYIYTKQFIAKKWTSFQKSALVLNVLLAASLLTVFSELSSVETVVMALYAALMVLFVYAAIGFPGFGRKLSLVAIGGMALVASEIFGLFNAAFYKSNFTYQLILILYYFGQFIFITAVVKDAGRYFASLKK